MTGYNMYRIMTEEDIIRGNKFICVFEDEHDMDVEAAVYLGKIFTCDYNSKTTVSFYDYDTRTRQTIELFSMHCVCSNSIKCDANLFCELSSFQGDMNVDCASRIILCPLESIAEEDIFLYEMSGSWRHINLVVAEPANLKRDTFTHNLEYDWMDDDLNDWLYEDLDQFCYRYYAMGCSFFDSDLYEADIVSKVDKKARSNRNKRYARV